MIEDNNKNPHSLAELMPHSELETHILKERAKQLSEQIIDKEGAIQANNYVRFKLGDHEFYGIPFQYIKEVVLNEVVTKVPNTPDCLAGIINHHGALLTVIDLKPLFHIYAEEKDTRNTHLIVITVNGITVAILVDNIEGSDTYDPMRLDAPLSCDAAIKPQYILGLDKGITAVLNMETLISAPQLNIPKTGSKP